MGLATMAPMTKGTLEFIALASLLLGCSGSTSPGGTCFQGGKTYGVGQTFLDQDGCNTCTCEARGMIACTLMACLSDAGLSAPDAGASSGNDAVSDARPGTDTVDASVAPDAKPVTDAVDAGVAPDGKSVVDAADASLASDAKGPLDGNAIDGLDAGAPSCSLPTSLSFGNNGGFVAYQDTYRIDAAGAMTISRTYYVTTLDAGTHTCTPALPACGTPGALSISTIAADLADRDVQTAFAARAQVLYGVDNRPSDGSVFAITSGTGATISVGMACPPAGASTTPCSPIPGGVQRLADDLHTLITAMRAQPACASL